MQKFYKFYNKHNALIYKCDTIEVAIKYWQKDYDIIAMIKYE